LTHHDEVKPLALIVKPYLAAVITVVTACHQVANVLTPSERAEYEAKLRKYQNMTNINETTFQEIWSNGLKNCK